MIRAKQVFLPQLENAVIYQEWFKTDLDLSAAMRGFWREMHDAQQTRP